MSEDKQSPQNSQLDEDSAEPIEVPTQHPTPVDSAFPVVGIGASAGGLAAFEAFFAEMPASTASGMAFVLVQHLAPDHKSILSDLIKGYTPMQVFEVTDGIEVQPNCAYIIPPNRDMAFKAGKLHLYELSTDRGQRMAIDFFFRSLAEDRHEHAICIVLSGTGSDGTLGVRAIKGGGGMAMAQEPESADYDGMPRSAIATGLVDFVLPPAEMPAQLIAYAEHAFGKRSRPAVPQAAKSEDALHNIFMHLRTQTGHDFSLYKENTILRRIERRMSLQQIDRIDGYVRYLDKYPNEVEALFQDLLIGVTSFFRDPEAFAIIEKETIPRLFAGKPSGSMARIWVPACSTGEEAYSLAILIQEYMASAKQSFKVQIFATDIDSRAIQIARTGVYPSSIAVDLTPERLQHFFEYDPLAGVYRIQKSIRDMLIISEHDIIQSPPFSRLDLISCRNLLIYMGAELQRKLIPLFHYALLPEGRLFLGTSESVGEFSNLFTPVDRKWKLYQRLEDVPSIPHPPMGQFTSPLTSNRATQLPLGKAAGTDRKSSVRELTERVLLQEYAPVSVLVDAEGNILYIHGRTGRFLEPAPGEAKSNILSMAREGLDRAVVSGLHKAAAQSAPASYAGLRVRANGHSTTVNLTVRPVTVGTDPAAASLYLVVLEAPPEGEQTAQDTPQAEDDAQSTQAKPTVDTPDTATRQIAALEEELQRKEEYLQTAIEEMETSNEELRSINEELQSLNEELQSTNEELETSKEELQSVNEELATVNAQLQQRVADLSKANNDFNNLLAGTGMGTIFVDHQLCIQRFTPAVTHLVNLIDLDIGRPVGHIVANLVNYDRLAVDVQTVLDTLIPLEQEVQTHAGAWYLLTIRPYRTLENVIEGAVIIFVDITRMKRAEALQRLAVVVRDAHDAITVQDFAGRILAWNPSAHRMYGWTEDEAIAMNVNTLVPENCRAEAERVAQQLAHLEVVAPYRTQRLAKDGQVLDVWLTATALVNDTGEVYAMATTEREIEARSGPEQLSVQ